MCIGAAGPARRVAVAVLHHDRGVPALDLHPAVVVDKDREPVRPGVLVVLPLVVAGRIGASVPQLTAHRPDLPSRSVILFWSRSRPCSISTAAAVLRVQRCSAA